MMSLLIQNQCFVEDHSKIAPRAFKLIETASNFVGNIPRIPELVVDYRAEDGRELSLSDSASRFLEIDAKGLEVLRKSAFKVSIEKKIDQSGIAAEVEEYRKQEEEIASKLKEEEYDLGLRIWQKEIQGKTHHFTKIGEDNYSSEDLSGLISFLKGKYLIESDKDRTIFSPNPLTAFGAVDAAWHAAGGNKSIFRYNWKQRDGLKVPRKKQVQPIIEDVEHFKIVIDGADDTASALNNTGLPQQTIALLQGLLIFPVFLKGVHLGYSGMRDDAKEAVEEYEKSNYKKAKIDFELKEFRKKICEICDINFFDEEENPSILLHKVALELVKIRKNPNLSDEAKAEKIDQIIEISDEYQRKLEEDPEITEIQDVLAAYTGWAAMTSMMTSIAAYELQAVMNIFGGVENVSTKPMGKSSPLFGKESLPPSDISQRVKDLPALSQVASYFGFAGQLMMSAYALHKAYEEGKEWAAVEEDLKQFAQAENVSDLARKISTKILKGKRDKHRTQTFGNIALSIGQAGMAAGGGIGTFAGLGLTLGGVAANSFSELRFQSSFEVNEDYDEFEIAMLNKPPKFTLEELKDIPAAVDKYIKEHIFKLEILGHLRAPQMVLYQEYLAQRQNERGFIGKMVGIAGGDAIARWINSPPQDSVKLVDRDGINRALMGGDDLDVFAVEQSDLDDAVKKAQELLSKGMTHEAMVAALQKEFMEEKLKQQSRKPAKSTLEICKEVLEKDKSAADYLKKKILRAISNGDLHYKAGEIPDSVPNIKKNGKQDISLVSLDIDKIDEAELIEFLTARREQKHTITSLKKRSALEEGYNQQYHDVKSAHLRPFSEIVKEVRNSENFVENFAVNNSTKTVKKTDKVLRPIKISNDNLLKDFDLAAKEAISSDISERKKQVKQQNKIINQITDSSEEFRLIDKKTDKKKKQTIFTYIDPDYFGKESDPNYETHKIIYVRDDVTKKIEVFYGKEAQAFVIEKAKKSQNGFIAKLDEEEIQIYGDSANSTFTAFKKIDERSKPNTSAKSPLKAEKTKRAIENSLENG